MGRQENIAVFENTKQLCGKHAKLKEAIRKSNAGQKFYPERKTAVWKALAENVIPEKRYEKPAQVIVSKKRTLEAAADYADRQVCVLNFASVSNPGGGVAKGSSAQEEAICRCSTLYENLTEKTMWAKFYAPHRKERNPLHNDDCIYTPEVVVFKTDTAYPRLLPEEKWYTVNVLTCAAPNLRTRPSNGMNSGDGDKPVRISQAELKRLHEKRMREVLDIAAAEGNEVVILGAFGCGAFCNPPGVVAATMKTVVEEYRYQFQTIEFAVYCSPRDDENYRVFQRALGRM